MSEAAADTAKDAQYRKEYAQFPPAVREIFHDIDAQLKEARDDNSQLTTQLTNLSNELQRLQTFNIQQEDLLMETEQYRQQIVEERRNIAELNVLIQQCTYSDQDNLRLQAVRDKEIRSLLAQQEIETTNLANRIKVEMAARAEAEKEKDKLSRSNKSLQIAEAEVAELEERLDTLATKLADDQRMFTHSIYPLSPLS